MLGEKLTIRKENEVIIYEIYEIYEIYVTYEILIRGHLKSSHIADKRKNFHMALYPLPPSSNESVIDNGRSVWQMAMHIILVLPHNCSNNVVCLTQGRFPGCSASIAKWTKETILILNSRRKIRFLLFFLFLHAQKWVAGVDECRSGCLSCITYLAPSTWPSIWKSQSTRSAMDLHRLPFLLGSRSRNDLQHFIGDLLLSASAAVRLVDGRAFCLFFFFFYCRSHNESGPNPLPPIWKFFRLSAMCELLRWPLTHDWDSLSKFRSWGFFLAISMIPRVHESQCWNSAVRFRKKETVLD